MAQQAGADAIGLVFFNKSPRFIDTTTASDICDALDCTKVGLFADATAAEVDAVLAKCSLDLLQFQGQESAEFCGQFGVPYVKAISVRSATDVSRTIEAFDQAPHQAWALQLDAYVEGQQGGTGQSFDWDLWPRTTEQKRLILAGGLTHLNVARAIGKLAPFGVDVSSGVEGRVKGQKDLELIRKFMQEVRSV